MARMVALRLALTLPILLGVSIVAFVMLFTNALPTWPKWGRVAFALAIWVNADPLIARLLLAAIDDD